ncbi:MAG TPA: putative colanic acid biosynthesis acetyltransferase [Opitutae bacterium]|nr:putative colanic acid biosynthesis acetyltransferase [Opitutae bacterium]
MGKRKSPWPLSHRIYKLSWKLAWTFFCLPSPKPFNRWRLLVLRCFGCQVQGNPFVHQSAKIENPRNLFLEDRACIGAEAVLYSLDKIRIEENSIIAQEAYLCTGTHEFESGRFDLITKPITVGQNAFVGARAFVLPGVVIGKSAVVGACSVVTTSVEEETTVAGNPSKVLPRKSGTN